MGRETTEITTRIRDHQLGKITDAELVEYLTNEVKYKPAATNPYKAGSAEWFNWSDGAKPDVPGSWGEVVYAYDTGLLSKAVFDKVMATFHSRRK